MPRPLTESEFNDIVLALNDIPSIMQSVGSIGHRIGRTKLDSKLNKTLWESRNNLLNQASNLLFQARIALYDSKK